MLLSSTLVHKSIYESRCKALNLHQNTGRASFAWCPIHAWYLGSKPLYIGVSLWRYLGKGSSMSWEIQSNSGWMGSHAGLRRGTNGSHDVIIHVIICLSAVFLPSRLSQKAIWLRQQRRGRSDGPYLSHWRLRRRRCHRLGSECRDRRLLLHTDSP